MKLVNVQSKWWWVPESNQTTLAVQIQQEQEYLPAIKAKLLALVEQAGPFPEVLEWATQAMESDGLEIQPTDSPENLVEQLLATASVGEMVRAGAPWMAQPAPPLEATGAVEGQAELTLQDFLM